MRRGAACVAALSACLASPAAAQAPGRAAPPAAASPQTSIVIALGRYDYQINGWQVLCTDGGRALSNCEARRPFLGPLQATIRVGDAHLQFELQSSCVNPPANYKVRSWDRRQPISTIDAARHVAAELNEALRGCREPSLPEASVYNISSLIFLLLQAVPIPAYVRR